jgi:gamma-glutamylcyclotransferase (GGCT)/AIG2-like uncharacterized protein YtfP
MLRLRVWKRDIMAKNSVHLFVYGTLRSDAVGALGKAQRERLVRESRTLGTATLAGARLYDLGRYPGLVESGAASDVVHGEVVALTNPARTFPWLDAYEGIMAGDPDGSDYARVERNIRLAHGSELSAWVYVYRKDIAHRHAIAGGRW